MASELDGWMSGVQVLQAAIAECPVPTVVAVGHASDVLVVSRVACRAFATPTEFGLWLREALLRKQARGGEAARARDIETGQMLVKQLEVLSYLTFARPRAQ